jgi:hypothetical protein
LSGAVFPRSHSCSVRRFSANADANSYCDIPTFFRIALTLIGPGNV